MDPTASILQGIQARARQAQARMIFAEGDDPRVLRAAVAYQRAGLGKALVVGREGDVKEKLEASGLGDAVRELEIVNAANSRHLETYKDFLYTRLQRSGFDRHDVHRLAARDRHVFSALMLQHGHGDGLITGVTRKSAHVLSLINLALLCGHVGRPSAGLNPLRGQNNVQGGGDMGAKAGKPSDFRRQVMRGPGPPGGGCRRRERSRGASRQGQSAATAAFQPATAARRQLRVVGRVAQWRSL
mgnify:CR=1 FL=1